MAAKTTARTFVTTWINSEKADDVARALGMSRMDVWREAYRCKQAGVNLPPLGTAARPPISRTEAIELNALINSNRHRD